MVSLIGVPPEQIKQAFKEWAYDMGKFIVAYKNIRNANPSKSPSAVIEENLKTSRLEDII